jgi:NAD(P)-dependent dehydrogenase (short-subunit alcohol dehydrogenase family)
MRKGAGKYSMKTVVITGASRGIGLATARLFWTNGWNVAATMRDPQVANELPNDERVGRFRLDVCDPDSIDQAILEVLNRYGHIDAWINNAGVGAYGPLEHAPEEQLRHIFEVNVFGVANCIRRVLPHMKARRSGVIVNISSIAGLLSLPLFSMTNASKFAIEGMTEGLHLDLSGTGVQVKLVEPSATKTDFMSASQHNFDGQSAAEYRERHTAVIQRYTAPRFTKQFNSAEEVASTIWEAANDSSSRLRYVCGVDAKALLFVRRWLGFKLQLAAVKHHFGFKNPGCP